MINILVTPDGYKVTVTVNLATQRFMAEFRKEFTARSVDEISREVERFNKAVEAVDRFVDEELKKIMDALGDEVDVEFDIEAVRRVAKSVDPGVEVSIHV